jgi:hypothetical protein
VVVEVEVAQETQVVLEALLELQTQQLIILCLLPLERLTH